MGKTYRVFTIKCRPNDPAGEQKTWDVLYQLAALVQHKESFRNNPRLGIERIRFTENKGADQHGARI
ncbi:hypothetical protein H1164_17145 [Thermoactinomyces daqus]|uniref:Uncharacterized protein n=1 Tax=Thermoactinomyces daqus TaxID=1329516 RepID=A0A7W2AK45_9BACL|nr:hypothetical protein [Thermoactinomyces daqus]MBA4544558.1 hypothetical protein [Thermoactinomyces daqus]